MIFESGDPLYVHVGQCPHCRPSCHLQHCCHQRRHRPPSAATAIPPARDPRLSIKVNRYMARSQPIYSEKKKKRLIVLSNRSIARRSAIAFPTSRMTHPAMYFNCGMSRWLRATQKSPARCPILAYVLKRISNTKNKLR